MNAAPNQMEGGLDRLLTAIFRGWRFPIITLSLLFFVTLLMGSVLIIPPGQSALAAFAEDFKIWCFGYDPETGFVGEPQATYFAATTQIYVAADAQEAFISASGPVIQQILKTPGLVAWTVGGDTDCQVNRTMTIWESEDAMYSFVTSGAHAEVMGQVTELSLTGKTVHWVITPEEIETQTWDTVRAKLDLEDPSELYD